MLLRTLSDFMARKAVGSRRRNEMRRGGSPGTSPRVMLALLLALPTLLLSGAPRAWAATSARAPAATADRATPAASMRPNIVVILTDDLDARTLAENLDRLPHVAALEKEGTTFSNFFVTTPECCPSRASILRGQYAHNHGVLHNRGTPGEEGGFATFHRLDREDSTVATWLQAAGYRTVLLGKYLNGYPGDVDPTYRPAGWNEWYARVDQKGEPFYFDYRLNENGKLVAYGHDPADYSTDVLSAKASSFIERTADSGDPFFLYLAPFAPHNPATPAPRDAQAFDGLQAPRTPSFNETDVTDKPVWVRERHVLNADQVAQVDELFRERMRSLLAVDDMVGRTVEALRVSGALDNTYIVFTSDNGFHLGEHRIAQGKLTPYDESIKVPLVVRGPGVATGRVEDLMASNIDLAPTVAGLVGAAAPDFVDGRSLVPLLRGSANVSTWRRSILIEQFDPKSLRRGKDRHRDRATPEGSPTAGEVSEESDAGLRVPTYQALRTGNLLYVEYATGEKELYDLAKDPYELQNRATTAGPAVMRSLSGRLAELRDCVAVSCRSAEDSPLPVHG
jgi:N-acetylglucosamine-6-sulfatase